MDLPVLYWLSFIGRTGFLGACVVRETCIQRAILRAKRLRIHPGGKPLVHEVDPKRSEPYAYRVCWSHQDCLLSKEAIERMHHERHEHQELKIDLLFPDFDNDYSESSEWLDGGNLFTYWQTDDIKRSFIEICEGTPVREVRYERFVPSLFIRKPYSVVEAIASNKVNV